jgi:septal ring factor EnvC (AmiA/AmiB activator)
MKKIKKMVKELKNFFKFIGGLAVAIAGIALYVFVQKKQDEELKKEIEDQKLNIARNEGVIDYNDKNILKLEDEEDNIEDNIERIKNRKDKEELGDFFKKRGF